MEPIRQPEGPRGPLAALCVVALQIIALVGLAIEDGKRFRRLLLLVIVIGVLMLLGTWDPARLFGG